MKQFILFFTLIIVYRIANGQSTFYTAFNNLGQFSQAILDVKVTTDNNLICLGTDTSVEIIKVSMSGNLLWGKHASATGDSSQTLWLKIAELNDQGIILIGQNTNSSIGSIYLLKLDSLGHLLFSKKYYYQSTNIAKDIIKSSDGGFVLVGGGCSAGNFALKCNRNGDIIWEKQYKPETFGSEGNVIIENSKGNYVIAGQILISGNYDVDAYEIDSSGNIVWFKYYETGSALESTAGITENTDGSYTICGSSQSYGPANQSFLLRITDTGALKWFKVYSRNYENSLSSVISKEDGSNLAVGALYYPGLQNNQSLYMKTDSNGDLIWSRETGNQTYNDQGGDWANSVASVPDGAIISGGSWDGKYIMKMSNNEDGFCHSDTASFVILSPLINAFAPTDQVLDLSFTSQNLNFAIDPANLNLIFTCDSTYQYNPVNNLSNEIFATISPNPSSGNFILSSTETIIDGTLQIFNALGEEVYKKALTNISKTEIHLNNVPTGIYFVKVKNGEKEFVQKLIIER